VNLTEHFDAWVEELVELDSLGNDLTLSDTKQCLFRPLSEPIDGTVVNQGWEHSQPGSEDLTQGAHGNDHMSIPLDLTEITGEHIHHCDLEVFLLTNYSTNFVDWFHIFSLVQVWNITSIQDIVDVFKHLLVYNLGINKKETGLFVLATSLHKGLLGILSPVLHSVTFDDFNLEQLVVGDESGQPR
jgi:hypothetical protein